MAFVRVLAAGLAVGLALLVLCLSGGGRSPALAQEPITIGFDMNTEGNSCPGMGPEDCTLGAIDTCVQVPTGGCVITIDTFLQGLPDGESITAFQYVLAEQSSQPVGTLTAFTHQDYLLNLIWQAVPRENLIDTSDPAGTSVPGWMAQVQDLFGGSEFNPPYTEGVLSRLTIDTTGTADGLYGLLFNDVILMNSDSQSPSDLCLLYGCNALDANSTPQQYGLIAIGRACPLAPDGGSVGGIAELPEVSDSAARTYAPLAALAAAALALALTAGAWYARRRWIS
jgi:hypothetical protein